MMKKKQLIAIVMVVLVLVVGVLTIVNINQGNYEEMTGLKRTAYAILNRDKIKDEKYVGEVSSYTWSAEDEYSIEATSIVMKEADEDFVIMNIADIHMSDYTQDAVLTIRTFDSIRLLVEEYQPDMITLSGDMVWKESTIYSAHRLTEFMDSLEIPWAPIFGNHDADGNCDLNYLADIMMESEYCLMQKGDASMGVGNYIVNICEEKDGKTEVVHSVIMMDSHNNGATYENQNDWYEWAVSGVNEVSDREVVSSLFLHIPFAQYQYAHDDAWDEENQCWMEGSDAFGLRREREDCRRDEEGNPIDDGLFAKIQKVGTTTNVICGHDHVNNYSVMYEDVRLTYSMRLGLGAYFDLDTLGVTLLTIDNEGEAEVSHISRYEY